LTQFIYVAKLSW